VLALYLLTAGKNARLGTAQVVARIVNCWLFPAPAATVLLLRELDRQARKEGGAVWMLNGNHESLNIAGDFRCVLCPRPACTLALAAGVSSACVG
jgi:hypothetical protein